MDAADQVAAERSALLHGLPPADAPPPTSNPVASAVLSPVPFDAAEFAAAADAKTGPAHGAVTEKLADQRESRDRPPSGRNRGSSGSLTAGDKYVGASWRSLSSAGVAAAITVGFVLALALRALLMGAPSWRGGEDSTGLAQSTPAWRKPIFGHLASKAPTATCQRFVPNSCYFLPGQSPRLGPSPSVRVDFEVADYLGQCPFASGGRYLNVPGPWCMEPQPDFWKEPKRLPNGAEHPRCGDGYCCGNSSVAGDFYRNGKGRLELDSSDMGCAYHTYTRKEALQCMARPLGRAAFAFVGDSMTRQIFMRMINLFRGEERSFDYAIHTAARYDVCGGPFPADRFIVAQQMEGQHPFAQIDELPLDGLLNGRKYQGPSPLDLCREPPVAADFVWAHDFVWQTHQIRRYILTHEMKDTVMTVLVSYHEQRADLDPIWLNAIGEAMSVAKKVIVMTIPTATYKEEFAPLMPIWKQRNELVREWIKTQPGFGSKLLLLDFDKLTLMKHAPTPLEGLDWHFQCIFNFEPPQTGMPMKAARHVEHRFLNPTGWALHKFIADEDRDCIDDMNRVMFQIIMNLSCNEE